MTTLVSQRTPEELARLGAEILAAGLGPCFARTMMASSSPSTLTPAISSLTMTTIRPSHGYGREALGRRSGLPRGGPAAYRMGRCGDEWRRECPQ